MSKIHKGDYFTVSHRIVEWRDSSGKVLCLLPAFTGGSLRLYLALCHFANRFGKPLFHMNDKRLVKVTGLSRRQLCRARNTLKKGGLIRTSQCPGLNIDYRILPMS